MTNRAILVGGGAFAREILDWASQNSMSGDLPAFVAFLDADPHVLDDFPQLGLKYLGDPGSYSVQPGDIFVMAIGGTASKTKLAAYLDGQGAQFASIVHRSAVVASTAKLGRGVVIGPHAYVATSAEVGDFASVNSLSGIGHDAIIGSCATISSQVDVMGKTVIGSRALLGSGARILPGVKVGDGAKIGSGAVIVRNVKPDTTMFAAPARKI